MSANNSKICFRAFPKKGTPRTNIFTNPINSVQFSSVQFSSVQSVVQIVANSNTIATYLTSEQHRATRHIALGRPRERIFVQLFICQQITTKSASEPPPKKGTPRTNIFTNPISQFSSVQFSSVQFSCSNRSK